MENYVMDLNKELDRAKTSLFLNNNAAFLGSLMCNLQFNWTTDMVATAGTDGISIVLNESFFSNLNNEQRKTILAHELWHVARLHHIRQGNRDPKIWNIACDHRINLDMLNDGFKFEGRLENGYFDRTFENMSEEEIYDHLIKNGQNSQQGQGMCGATSDDLLPSSGDKAAQQNVVNAVVQAMVQAQMSKTAGSIPGSFKDFMDKFMKPKVPWEVILKDYMTDILDVDSTWNRPNRRFQDIYLPSLVCTDGRLEHLMFFLDVSGSISDDEARRFCTEVKYIQEVLNPQKLTLVQFDHQIQKKDVYEEYQEFNGIEIVGRGGTNLEPVRKMILKEQPTAAVIFSDLWCTPMEKIDNIPLIWIVMNNPSNTPDWGKSIHITPGDMVDDY